MCGFLGLWAEGPLDQYDVTHALDSLSHRGPDGAGTYTVTEPNVYFGHRRLAFCDRSSRGSQPIVGETGVAAMLVGEIYNFRDLGHVFRGGLRDAACDTEVLLRLYEEQPSSYRLKMNGMYTTAIYDPHAGQLRVARDPFGQKPLYYVWRKDEYFAFASEIEALRILLRLPLKIGRAGICRYLAGLGSKAPFTAFEGVKKAHPGEQLVFDGHRLRTGDFVSPDQVCARAGDSSCSSNPESRGELADTARRLGAALSEAVQRRLPRGERSAVLLSGGIDSGLVAAMASNATPKPILLTLDWNGGTNLSEIGELETTAKHLDNELAVLRVTSSSFLRAARSLARHLDDPISDPAMILSSVAANWLRSKGCRVAMTGEGADELFLGYDEYYTLAEFRGMNLHLGLSQRWLTALMGMDDVEVCTALYGGESADRTAVPARLPEQRAAMDLHWWLAEILLMKLEKAGMQYALEYRSPFLDPVLQSVARSIQPDLRTKRNPISPIRLLASGHLPRTSATSPKRPLIPPTNEWLLRSYGRDLLRAKVMELSDHLPWIRPRPLSDLLSVALDGWGRDLWSLWFLREWVENRQS